ncbi:thrombospondin type 3 repeat-containing protein [Candidatus Woesearchaeota archaeon]|nr:thrombospondin type 3 repeat-containing protein [Candidatus Woesearchaeota archaeon]
MNRSSILALIVVALAIVIVAGFFINSSFRDAVSGKNQAQTDSDGDTILDQVDNCPYVANQNQLNRDGDIYGDLCDRCVLVSGEDNFDSDDDSFGDLCDNCPQKSNRDQADRDSDTVGDVCDETPLPVEPVVAPLAEFCHYVDMQGRTVPDRIENRFDLTLGGVVTHKGIFRNACSNINAPLPQAVDWRDIGKQHPISSKNYYCSDKPKNPDGYAANRAGGDNLVKIEADVVCRERLGCDVSTGRCCVALRAENLRCEGTVFKNETFTSCGSDPVTVISDCATMGQYCNAKGTRQGFGPGCMPKE